MTNATSSWQSFNDLGHTDFVVAAKEPVIIVPGVAGTYLNRVSDGQEVWPNVDLMAKSILNGDLYLDDLQLATNGQQVVGKEMVAGDIIRNESLVGLFPNSPYGNLIDIFAQEGYIENQNLFVVPYDWRMDVSSQEHILDAKIAAAIKNSPTGKVNIIGHSLGTLLIKHDLAQRSDTSFVDKLVLVGSPQLGGPVTLKYLTDGNDFGIPILNADEIKKIAQNMPSVYQLLPSRQYIQNAGDYVEDYDSQGRHTGPLPDGDIELGIPGSTYEKFGENSFVLVPESTSTYRVIDQATASGTFMMKVKGYIGSTVDKEATYISVPLQGTSTKAELDFSGFGNNMGLKLDKNGDGVTDAIVQPNAILSTSSISDVAPPVLTMPTIPSQVVQSNSAPNPWIASSTSSFLITNTSTGVISFDVTKDIRSFLSGSFNYGWMLKKTDENVPGRIELGSKESSQGPKLKIIYSP